MDLLAFVMALQAEGKTAEEVKAALDQYLEDNPDAIDQAAIEAILDGRLDDIEDDVGDLKSALSGYPADVNSLKIDVRGETTTSSKSFSSSNSLQDVLNFDAVSGKQYAFTVTLSASPSAAVYLYIIDKDGHYVESTGSITSISTSQTSKTFNKTFESNYNNIRLAIKASSGCSMSSASITASNIEARTSSLELNIQELQTDTESIDSRLGVVDGIINLRYEHGNWSIASDSISYNDTKTENIRIANRGSIKLYAGDILTADTGCEFYLAYRLENSATWVDLLSWRTSYTVITTGIYAIKMRNPNATTTPVPDVNALGSKLHFTMNSCTLKQVANLKTQVLSMDETIGGMNYEVNGTKSIPGAAFESGTDYQTIHTFDVDAGATYEFNLTLASVPNKTIYLYFIDENNNYIESTGSVSSIGTSATTKKVTKRFSNNHANVRFALKGASGFSGCILTSGSLTTDYTVDNRLNAVQSQTQSIEGLRKKVFDLSGKSDVENIEVASGNSFTTLYKIDLKAGTEYSLGIELTAALSSGTMYAYLVDSDGNYVGADGSLFYITGSQTSKSASVTLNASYEDVSFAVKCSDSSFVVKKASITFTPNNNDGFVLPDYYYANDYIDEKVDRINELAEEAGADGDVFIFITDEHLTQNQGNSYALIKYIAERTHIARLFDGGDGYNGGNDAYARKIREAFGVKAYFAMGNHEWFDGATGNNLYYKYDSVNNDQIGNPERHYYYVDDVQVKTRYIVMSAFAEPEQDQGYSGAHYGYEAEQISWLTNTALNVSSGWTIIIITHAVYYGNFTNYTWYMLPFAEDFVNAIDNYNGNGKIAFVMQGHLHADGVNYTPGGIPVIAVTSDKNGHWINQGTDMEPFLNGRVTGTTTEQAFDVVIHNRKTKTINCVRIGGFATFDGEDMEELIEAGEREITYT